MATVPATIAACPNGGVEIDSGLDTNHDGILEPSEVTSRENVCAPAAPTPQAQQVVRVVAEPAGSNCPAGGVAVESGTDTNGNSVLDDGEVTSTTYVCAGEDGQNGSAGENGQNGSDAANLLVRVDVEPAGSNCPSGGEAVRVGADVNGDGVLQDTEVEDTAYLCGPLPAPTVIDGDYVIANSLDVAALAGVTDITGNVRVTSTTITSLSLPNLQHVGSFTVYSTPLTALSLPSLVAVGGPTYPGEIDISEALSALDLSSLTSAFVVISGDNLDALSFPSLERGGIDAYHSHATSLSTTLQTGRINISDARDLASVSLDDLTRGTVLISYVPVLQRLDLPAMVSADGYGTAVQIQDGAPQLATVSVPSLLRGDVVISESPSLTTLDVRSLQQSTVHIADTALTTLSLPALTAAPTMVIVDDPALTSISAPNLTAGTANFTVATSPQLPTCMAQALAAQCGATNVSITGTDDTATCP